MPVAPDEQIGEHSGILEQFDVLEGAGDAELRDVVGWLRGMDARE
jgi:hypothetical protein